MERSIFENKPGTVHGDIVSHFLCFAHYFKIGIHMSDRIS